MRVKTFRAASAPAAFAKVKAEMGDDAVILSNQTVEEDGCKFCEVTAAIEQGTPARSGGNGKHPGARRGNGNGKEQPMTREEFLTSAMENTTGWAREWDQIKGHIMALLKPQMNLELLTPRQRLAFEYLEREGVDNRVLMDVYRDMLAHPEASILSPLEKMVDTKPFTPGKWPQKFHVFAGPGGSGKTSALIRLALQEKKANPRARICLACADLGQGKGRIVLRHYAELSGLGYREVTTREDFAQLKSDAASFDRVFIDMAGLSGTETLLERMTTLGMAADGDLCVHLVLSPYYCPKQYEKFATLYDCPQSSSIIWTKLDEACTFGAMINMAHSTGLPASALSYGAGLKNSLTAAQPEKLWRMVFKHQLPTDKKVG